MGTNSTTTGLSLAELSKMNFAEVLDDSRVKDRFISLCKQRKVTPEEAEAFYENEKWNFSKTIRQNAKLKKSTGFSIYGCFMDIAIMGLTVENLTDPLLYVMTRSYYNQNKEIVNASIKISPYGELALRLRAGQILYADTPVICYEGDEFAPMVNEKGDKICVYRASVPRKSTKIIGSFIKLTRPNGSIDTPHLLIEDIERLRGFSEQQNGRYKNDGKDHSNALYTSCNGGIDPGFLAAKTIKHAFKSYPKIMIGVKFSKFDEGEIQAVDYGLTDEIPQENIPGQPGNVVEAPSIKEEKDPFGGADIQQNNGIVIEDNDDIF